jgi:hypothetical protein
MPAAASTITAPAAYTAAPDVALQFQPDEWIVRATAGNAFVSLDGAANFFSVRVADAAPLVVRSKSKAVWVKQDGGAATVLVAAFTTV